MVDVNVEILGCSNLQPPRNFTVKYVIKTFWCKSLEIIEKLECSTPIKLPLLLMSDYWRSVENGIGRTLFIEIWYTPATTATKYANGPNSESLFVGLSRFSLDAQLTYPNLNPVWTYLPVDRVLDDSVVGKLGIKVSATLTSNGNLFNNEVDRRQVSSYFGSVSSDPVVTCRPPLPPLESSNNNKNKQVQRPTTTVPSSKDDQSKPKTTTTATRKSNVRKSTSVKRGSTVPERDKKIQTTKKGQQQQTAKSGLKVPAAVSHNMLTSPDFPFRIPAVHAIEKKIKFDLEVASGKTPKKFQNPNVPVSKKSTSPALFGYTPFVPKDLDDIVDIETSYQSVIPEKPSVNDTRISNDKDMLAGQNDVAELLKPRPHERGDRKEADHPIRHMKVLNLGEVFSELDLSHHTKKLSPNRIPDQKPNNMPRKVPGMKITKYKRSTENLVDPFKSPSKRRIAANIFQTD